MSTHPALRRLSAASALLLAFLMSGCFETKQEYTLNPDGSGKVVHESTFQTISLTGESRSSDAQVKAAVAEFLRNAKGVSAWSDISYELQPDGRIHFRGTAYFPNLSELDLQNQSALDFEWTPGASGSAVLALRTRPEKPAEAKPSGPTKDELKAQITEARMKYQQSKPMLAMILGTMRHEVTIHLPGKRGAVTGFQPAGPSSVKLQFEGTKIIAAMDQLTADDKWMERNADTFGGNDGPPMDEELNGLIFGEKAPVRAAVAGLAAPAFDYEAEVAAAKASFAAVQQELRLGPVAVVRPAEGGPLKGLKVVGIRLAAELDEQLELQPFGSNAGCTLALLAELPGAVHAITDESGLDSAMADDGSDLLPDSDFRRRFTFPKLSADKSFVLLEAELKLPGSGVAAVKELTGHVQYSVAGEPKEVDLGLPQIVVGAKGTAYGAEIKSIESDGDTAQQMDLLLQLEPDILKSVFLVKNGTKVEIEQRGYGGGNGEYVFQFHSETGFPPGARLVIEVYGDLQLFDTPFKLENIPLPQGVLEAR